MSPIEKVVKGDLFLCAGFPPQHPRYVWSRFWCFHFHPLKNGLVRSPENFSLPVR